MRKEDFGIELSLSKVGAVVRQARRNLRYSYRDLSKKCGVSATQLQRIESGKHECSAAKLFKVCTALGVPITDLLSYAIERSIEIPPIDLKADKDVTAAVAWAEEMRKIPQEEALSAIHSLVRHLFFLLLDVLSGSKSPVTLIGQLTHSSKCNQALEFLQIQIDSLSNVERVAMVESLRERPLEKLKALQLIGFEVFQEVLGYIAEQKEAFAHGIPPSIERTLQGSGQLKKVISPGALAAYEIPEGLVNRSETLDKVPGLDTVRAMQLAVDPVGSLINRVRQHLGRRGVKAQLARDLGVTRQAVSNWLKGSAIPTAEAALRLLQWVEAEEAKQQAPTRAATPVRAETQSQKSHEKKSKSSPET